MGETWWMIPIGAAMLWIVIKGFRSGGPPSGRDESSTSSYDWGGDVD